MSTTVRDGKTTLERARGIQAKLVEIRRKIHSRPELSFNEYETSKLVVGELSELGLSVQPGVGRTGVVAEIGEGRTIIIRADMDALPIQEVGGRAYSSQSAGVMHACGHDVHTTCALGAAMLLAETPPKNGCVRFLFQPAEETVNEEGKSGATLMIEDGATFDAEGIFALHVDPRIPVGQIAVREGAVLAACDSFDIVIKGVGTHGAYPQYGVDAIVLAAHVLQSLQAVVSRRKSALEPAVLTVGGIRSKTYASNIVAEEVEITGTVRYFDSAMHEFMKAEIARACAVADALGGSHQIRYSHDTPPLTNDAQLTNLVRYVGRQVLGKENVAEMGRETGGDDFSYLSAHMPGCYFALGAAIEGSPHMLHTPEFDVNEEAIPVGAAMLAECALRYLGG